MGPPDRDEASGDARAEAVPGDEVAGGPAHRHPTAAPFGPRYPQRRSKWILIGAVIAGVALLAALFGFALGRDPSVISSPLVGRPAPDFALRTLDGGQVVRLSRLRGQVVVINFWASWCAACREEHPYLGAAWDRYRDQGVVLLGIDYQDRRAAALSFMREMGGDWPVLEDPGGKVALAFGVYGVPETYFIGQDGIVEYKRIGPSSYGLLTEQIQRLLDGGR